MSTRILEDHLTLINQTLERLIPKAQDSLCEAAHYSLDEGKRLRPLLTLAVTDTFGVPIEKALYPACALEMVHTYSLIHDDLPSMDDDDMRRGKPTLHKVYPENHAILTGDFLLTYAFETLANAPYLSDKEKVKLIHLLSHRSGRNGMVGGQVLDLSFPTEIDLLIETAQKKTGALITAALEFGAVIAMQDLSIFQTLGSYLGLSFQIVDDILDQDGIVALIGMEKARKMVDELHSKTLEIIHFLPISAPLLENLALKIISRLT